MKNDREASLLCRVGSVRCALPLQYVEETMRPLPVEPMAGAPVFVRGLAIVRGSVVPVVDAGSLLGGGLAQASRFVMVKARSRRVALVVDAVEGVGQIARASLNTLPPLLRDANLEAVAAIGTLDAELLVILRSSRLVPDEMWALLQTDNRVA